MVATLQLDEAIERSDAPKLLVEWTSRRREFMESIKPALARSEARLAGEAPFGLIPVRIMVPSYVLEAILILAAIFVPAKIAELRPYVAPRIGSHDVIYYSGDELPRTQDLGGAQAGASGAAGGEEAHHRTQTIKIARGSSLVSQVVDAPNLKLPASRDAVANLLAIQPDPGPPPAAGLRSQRSVTNLATTIVAPSPDVIRDYTRNGIQLESVIAPAPTVTRDRPLTAPSFSPSPIPPAPNVASDHTLVAPALAPSVVPPAPHVTRDRTSAAPSLAAQVVAPAPSLPRDPFRSSPTMAGTVIPPAPGSVSRQISSAPMQTMDANVVPPPVSAPERAGVRNPKLSLPAPSVVAPPPSANISSDMRRLASGSVPDPAKNVVPPPPSQSSGSLVSTLIGKIFGTQEVVPPPPSVNSKGAGSGTAPSLASSVVPPPPSVSAGDPNANSHGRRNGAGASLGANVVAPPPSVGTNGGVVNQSRTASAPYLGNPSVVPPPPSLAGRGGGTGTTAGGAGAPGGTLLANNVVPPPPTVGGGSGPSGSGLSRKGAGLGTPLDVGSNIAPTSAAGSGKDAGTIVSSQPGTKVGLPASGSTGALAMSPAGGDKVGLGGNGGGSAIGRGTGSGSSVNNTGPGAAKSGNGRGSENTAHGGISSASGPGGAGNVTSGTPAVPGVDISGGSGVVTLPSFGSDPNGTDPTSAAVRSAVKSQPQTLGVTVVATAGSGGAFEPYKKLLHGENYTTYLDTSAGTVVMEFADESTSAHPFGGTLSAPAAVRTDLPDGLPRARMVVTCTLDASGNVKNPRVLEAGPATMTAKVLAALRGWKFQPAMRNNQPVEVTAILGFGIDTNDRF